MLEEKFLREAPFSRLFLHSVRNSVRREHPETREVSEQGRESVWMWFTRGLGVFRTKCGNKRSTETLVLYAIGDQEEALHRVT